MKHHINPLMDVRKAREMSQQNRPNLDHVKQDMSGININYNELSNMHGMLACIIVLCLGIVNRYHL